jgi:hypothetical protein
MPVTEISLSTGCLAEGFGVTRTIVSAGVFASAVALVTGGVFVTAVVFASCDCANRGERMQNATTTERKLTRKFPTKQCFGLRSANTKSKTRLLGTESPGQLNSIGKLPTCAESYGLERGQYMFKI